jgi:hypothetical protein
LKTEKGQPVFFGLGFYFHQIFLFFLETKGSVVVVWVLLIKRDMNIEFFIQTKSFQADWIFFLFDKYFAEVNFVWSCFDELL